MYDDGIKDLQREVVGWADGVSPARLPKDAVVKMVSETSELLDAVLNGGDVEGELGDCIILLLDLANMHRIDLVQAGRRKMAINWQRNWINDNGVIRRERGNGPVGETEAGAGEAVSDLSHES